MSDEYQRTDRDREAGSIGIGAMIVFIALILVAAVASTIIIKTAEELQQNAESTSDDTRKQISGKISILDVFVKSTADPLTTGTGKTMIYVTATGLQAGQTYPAHLHVNGCDHADGPGPHQCGNYMRFEFHTE